MEKEYQILPTNRKDRLITNWDYDEHGRWGQKQCIMCWFSIICFYGSLFMVFFYYGILKHIKN